MQDWQNRVIDEKEALGVKALKLHRFITSDLFNEVPLEEQKRMHRQWLVMQLYQDVLEERIANFK